MKRASRLAEAAFILWCAFAAFAISQQVDGIELSMLTRGLDALPLVVRLVAA